MGGPTLDAAARLHLQRLAKGALFVGIAAAYVLLLSLTLVDFGWRPALLALFLVLVGQGFRHIANEADRIGLTLAGEDGAQPGAHLRNYQRRMLRLFAGLTQLPNDGIGVQAFLLGGRSWGIAATGTLLVIELWYLLVRSLNRRTAFREASYGFRDPAPLGGGRLDVGMARDLRAADVEGRLTELRAMVRDGRISQRAYEKACDRYRVRAVMARRRRSCAGGCSNSVTAWMGWKTESSAIPDRASWTMAGCAVPMAGTPGPTASRTPRWRRSS